MSSVKRTLMRMSYHCVYTAQGSSKTFLCLSLSTELVIKPFWYKKVRPLFSRCLVLCHNIGSTLIMYRRLSLNYGPSSLDLSLSSAPHVVLWHSGTNLGMSDSFFCLFPLHPHRLESLTNTNFLTSKISLALPHRHFPLQAISKNPFISIIHQKRNKHSRRPQYSQVLGFAHFKQ
jgi:hypothetical protein